MKIKTFSICFVCCLSASAQQAKDPDTTTFDADGTAHISRVVPVPLTLSPEARKLLATGASWAPGPRSAESKQLIADAQRIYPVHIEERTIGGVKVSWSRRRGAFPRPGGTAC